MTTPKEPNFFSDDQNYARGVAWYLSLFSEAAPKDLCGESSTHYTKLPNHPCAARRIHQHVPGVRLIYVMRHPIDRLVSHYIHDWTENKIKCSIDQAVQLHPELIQYSRYAMQLTPYMSLFGPSQVLPVFLSRLKRQPQEALKRICRFIGYDGQPVWRCESDNANSSADRMRKSRLRDAIVYAPGISAIRRRFIPKSWRERVKSRWTMKGRPTLSVRTHGYLTDVFDEDLAELGSWLGIELSCDNFEAETASCDLGWIR